MKCCSCSASVTSTQSIAHPLADFSSIIRSGAAQAEPGDVWGIIAFEKGCYLYAFDITQETRSIVIHLWSRTCCCKCCASSLRPDQPSPTGDLSACENHCLKSHLCQWTHTIYRLNDCFWYSSSA